MIQQLEPGTVYSVLVAATNDRGTGPFQRSSPRSAAPLVQSPDSPQNVELFVASSTALRVLFEAPVSDGGIEVTSYVIEWDTSSTFMSGVG